MLLTITTGYDPATDLGYLLHKHPARLQTFPLSFGKAHVFYPEASQERCTAALLLEVDPVELARGNRHAFSKGSSLAQYVNDRPYTANSFLSVAISRVFGTALAGRSKERPELAGQPLPLEAELSVVACRGGEDFLRELFEPLGYEVEAEGFPLDASIPEWGASPYYKVRLRGRVRLSDLLTHLYVLVPVLDNEKHYWIGEEEVEKLIHKGESWLDMHPQKQKIVHRYLQYRKSLTRSAMARLTEEETEGEPESENIDPPEKVPLNRQRLDAVFDELKKDGAVRVMDLGCGEGRLLKRLVRDKQFQEVLGVDVSPRALEIAERRVGVDRLPLARQGVLRLLQGSLVYRDERLTGFDAAAVVEVIEHLEPFQLHAFEKVLFGVARPQKVVLTTPNADYNVRFDGLPAGKFRHSDHRFEWTRSQFRKWGDRTAAAHGYSVRYLPVGELDPEVGSPTQMAVFIKEGPEKKGALSEKHNEGKRGGG